jgi:hypothetical protein
MGAITRKVLSEFFSGDTPPRARFNRPMNFLVLIIEMRFFAAGPN